MNRNKWDRRSMPYGLEYYSDFEDTGYSTESSLPLFLEEQEIKRTFVYHGRKHKSVSEEQKPPSIELSTDQYSPGVLKIYGDTIYPGVEYKSVLASYRSTALELVKQALERYGLSPNLYKEYVLCDVVGRFNQIIVERGSVRNGQCIKWQRLCTRTLSNYDKPLLLQNFWFPAEGYSRRYELRLKSEFSANAGNDDTQGINENARKISISKLRRGAIPFFTSWEKDKLDRFADELNLEGTLSRSHSPLWKSQTNDTDNVITGGLNLDIGLTSPGSRSPISLPQKMSVEYFMAPVTRPFLLTLRGCDVNRDSVFHVIEHKTVLVCNTQAFSYDVPSISLFSEDIHSKHCYLHLKRTSHVKKANNQQQMYNYCLEVECPSASNVKVNGYPISRKTTIYSGDILSMGAHYLFLFKDLTGGHEIPMELSWLYSEEQHNSEPLDYEHNDLNKGGLQTNVHIPPLKLETNDPDDTASVFTLESNMDSSRDKFCFAYSREKEEELINDIGAMVRQNYIDLPLTPAYLYSMCIEYACKKYEPHQIKKLLLSILMSIRESVADLSKTLSANKHNCGLVKSRRHSLGSEDCLRYMIQWMSNAVQLILHLRGHNFKIVHSSKKYADDPQKLFIDLASGLEEIVIFCFQQTIYTVTKALYGFLSEILDSNPFSEVEPDRKSGIGKLIAVFNHVAKLTSTQYLHIDVGKHIFMYLFFFCSTSVFNRLLLKETGPDYYNWPSGVRIRANLGILEDWATRNGLDEEFGQLFEKLLSAAEFLSTSRNLLLKYDWMSMKRHFHPLNEAQLFRLLSQYDLGGKSYPKAWRPVPEDKYLAHQEDTVMLEMSQHPPFLLPQDNSIIDLVHPPDHSGFWAFFKQLYAQYGVHEEDNGSGISPTTTPKFTGNFPKVELQKSFFKQGAKLSKTAKKLSSNSPHMKMKHSPRSLHSQRRVQFVTTNETDSSQTTPSPRETTQSALSSGYDNDTGSDITDVSRDHKNNNNNKQEQNLSAAIQNCQSADYRLDLLIKSSRVKSQTELVSSESEIEYLNNRHSPPPPLPPRNAKPAIGSDIEIATTSDLHPRNIKEVNNSNIGCKLNLEKGDVIDANGITNDLLYELNNESQVGKDKRRSLNTELTATTSGGKVTINNLNDTANPSTEKISNLPVFPVKVVKGDKGLGLGLIDGLYTPLRLAGIYIRKILPESPASEGGQLHVGDRILSVNGKSIIGADYQSAMKLIRAGGENLTLLIAKGNHSVATKVTSTSC